MRPLETPGAAAATTTRSERQLQDVPRSRFVSPSWTLAAFAAAALAGWLGVPASMTATVLTLLFAVVVGPILIAINHGDALLAGEADGGRWLKMALTLLVPYLVSTISSVAATRRSAA